MFSIASIFHSYILLGISWVIIRWAFLLKSLLEINTFFLFATAVFASVSVYYVIAFIILKVELNHQLIIEGRVKRAAYYFSTFLVFLICVGFCIWSILVIARQQTPDESFTLVFGCTIFYTVTNMLKHMILIYHSMRGTEEKALAPCTWIRASLFIVSFILYVRLILLSYDSVFTKGVEMMYILFVCMISSLNFRVGSEATVSNSLMTGVRKVTNPILLYWEIFAILFHFVLNVIIELLFTSTDEMMLNDKGNFFNLTIEHVYYFAMFHDYWLKYRMDTLFFETLRGRGEVIVMHGHEENIDIDDLIIEDEPKPTAIAA